MPVAARQNQVAEYETPISSSKYNEEINNLYLYVNRLINRFQSATPPENPLVNNVWLDTSSEPAVLRSYNGSTWVWAGVYAGSTAPENPSSGALFVDTDTWDMHVFDGTLGGWINLLDAMSEEIATMLETMAGYLSDAEDYTAQAFGYKESAEGASATAVAAESLAEKWASENVNVVVADGKYSAKHWATKAEDYAGTGSGVFEVYEGKNQSIDARILNMRNERVENLGSPSADTDAATKGYADSVGSAAQGYADTLVPAPTEDGQVFTSDSGAGVWADPPSGLPDIEAADETKVLTVVSGAAAWAAMAGVPAGVFVPYAGETAPAGWLLCDGSAVSRTTYAALFAAIGEAYGAGDGSTTFNLPDMRGEFLRGWDNGRGIDSGRALGSSQSGQNQSHAHSGSAASAGAHSHTASSSSSGSHGHSGSAASGGSHSHTYMWHSATAGYQVGNSGHIWTYPNYSNESTSTAGAHTHSLSISSDGTHSHSVTVNSGGAHDHTLSIGSSGGTEARPRNVAANFIIKT